MTAPTGLHLFYREYLNYLQFLKTPAILGLPALIRRGAKQVGRVTSAERGTEVTLACAVPTTVKTVPFFYIPLCSIQAPLLDAKIGSDGGGAL